MEGTPLTPLSNSLLFRTGSSRSGSNPRTPSPSAAPAHGSPSRSPRRMQTDPNLATTEELRQRVHKRIILCCDGTWQDGISELHRSRYTNVLRLARTIQHEDVRFQPPIPQVVYYQSGIGTEKNLYSEYVQGTTGGSLADKIEEAYSFIAHNYNPGDEIFLFGFSRGAYTARMVAMLIGEFGVLDRKDMDHFAKIFICYQKLGKLGKSGHSEERAKLREELEPFCKPDARGKLRVDGDGDSFTIKCIGVFDTVGSVGLPETLTRRSPKARNLLGMKDPILGDHVERAYQALALNERRRDFRCNKWEQTESGRAKKQILDQCWFAGAHSDIGGGYEEHDLADLTLIWMAARIEDILGLDLEYLAKLPDPVAPWGKQKPHEKSGIFALLPSVHRPIPTGINERTRETIHPSVLEQTKANHHLAVVLRDHPEIVANLEPLEEAFKKNWPFVQDSAPAKTYSSELEQQIKASEEASATITLSRISQSLRRSFSLRRPRTASTAGREYEEAEVEDEEEEEAKVVQFTHTSNKLKKARRQSTPLPSISVVADL